MGQVSTNWWQSIRWRLTLGSVLVALLATVLLVLTALLAIIYYYGGDQQTHMRTLAADNAHSISLEMDNAGVYTATTFAQISAKVLSETNTTNISDPASQQQYLTFVLDHRNKLLYPYSAQQAAVPAFIV